jgi:hypothetical protein
MVETPDGHGRLELTKFHAPTARGGDRHAPANTRGIRHISFAVDDTRLRRSHSAAAMIDFIRDAALDSPVSLCYKTYRSF